MRRATNVTETLEIITLGFGIVTLEVDHVTQSALPRHKRGAGVTRKGAAKTVVSDMEGVTVSLLDQIAAAVRDLPPDHVWTVDMVAKRLVAAVRLCNRIGGPVRPSDRAVGWPSILRDWGDLLGQVETDEIGKDKEPRRYTATAREVSEMTAAISWAATYLGGDQHEAQRRVLALWLRCKVTRGRKFSEAIKRKRWSKATSYRVRDRALLTIALGLMRDQVMP
jgi:hypothetical protein